MRMRTALGRQSIDGPLEYTARILHGAFERLAGWYSGAPVQRSGPTGASKMPPSAGARGGGKGGAHLGCGDGRTCEHFLAFLAVHVRKQVGHRPGVLHHAENLLRRITDATARAYVDLYTSAL